jgi:prepilin-type N-terminal cleavage/methylation domain-containing protein
MYKNLRKRTEGFTIIEVLIVLAIAGLIMLIVFLAVPALQRNSRNSSYRNEASQLLSAATEFSNNNNGAVPASGDATTILGLTKTKSITNLTIGAGSTAVTPAFDAATIRTGVRCGTITGNQTHTPAASSATRALVIIYAVESGSGGVVAQCTES